jgi:hypothetical protein
MKWNKWILFLLLFIGTIAQAQTSKNKIALTSIISTIEKEFNVKFSYAVEDVAAILIEKPDTGLTLEETIAYLNSKVLLNFKALDNRYVTVSVLEKTFSVCGIVFAQDTQTSLPGASVRIESSSSGPTTSANGAFKLDNLSIGNSITISYIGYESKQFTANEFFSADNNCKKIFLKPSKEELNQVLINVYLTPGLQKYLDGSTVLNTKKFGILPGLVDPDILQSIQVLPGVESTNESIANINVRGGTNDQNLMLWDNIKMYHSGHFFGLISAYNPNVTNKVTVSKNGTSAAFSDGVSSTINMSTNDKVGTTLSGGGGANLISADAYLEIPLAKNLELDISARRSVTDLINTPTFTNYYQRSFQDTEINADSADKNTSSDFYFYDFTAKLLFDLNDKHSFRANIIGINNALNYAEYSNTDQGESKVSRLSQKNLGYGGHWKGQWTDAFSTEVITYFSKYNIDATDYRVETDQLLTEANEVLETGTTVNATYKATSNLTLLLGYQVNETGMLNQTTVSAPSFSSTKKDVLLNQAVYTEAEYKNDNTYLRIGMRMNYFDKFDKLIAEPRINFRQQISKRFALKLEGEFKNQTATQVIDFEDDFLGVEKRRWVLVNNKDIPIATSKQSSLGLEFKHNKLNVELTGFYKIVDGITASNQGFYNNFQSKNASGSYTAKGIEFLANKTARKFSTWLSYTFSTNDYQFDSFTPSTFRNNVDIRHSVSIGFNYDVLENLKISVGGIWRNGQPYTRPLDGNETVKDGNTIRVNYGAPNSENLDNFMRLDASFSYSFNLSTAIKATLRGGVINSTNEDNIINRYYKVDPNDDSKTIAIKNSSLGMTPNISFRVNF